MMLCITRGRRQSSPVSGETSKETVKTIARGMPGVSGVTVVTNARVFYHHARLRAHQAPGIPCALSMEGGNFVDQLGRFMSREGEGVFA
jgi:hypothetical protein